MTYNDKQGGYVVYLCADQIDLVIKVLSERHKDLEAVLKAPDGLSSEFIQELQLELRNINSVIRELMFYADSTTTNTKQNN